MNSGARDLDDDSLSLEGLEKFLDFIAPEARALHDTTPLGAELRTRYEAVIADTDQFADQFLDEAMKEFMRLVMHSIAARHPDIFMKGRRDLWRCRRRMSRSS